MTLRLLLFLALFIISSLIGMLGAYHRMPAFGILGVALLAPASGAIFGQRWAAWLALALLPVTIAWSVYNLAYADLTPDEWFYIADPIAALWVIIGGSIVGLVLLVPYFRKY